MIHNLVICSNVFIRKDGKFLLLRRADDKKFAPGFVHPFGGKVDHNENPFEAALREIREEVGIELKNMKLEAVITELQPNKSAKENWIIFHFSADYDSGEIKDIDPYDGVGIYLDRDEIKHKNLFPSVEAIIDRILDDEIGTIFTTMSYSGEESGANIEKLHYSNE